MLSPDKFEFSAKPRNIAIVLFLVGIASIGYGISQHDLHHRLWANLLLGSFYFTALSLAGVLFLAIQYAVKASWSIAIRRIPEALSCYLPIAAVTMLLMYFGLHDLYHWTHEGITDPSSPHYDALLAGKASFLNVKFFMIRMVVFLAIWNLFGWLFRKNAATEESSGDYSFYKRNFRMACVFLIFFGVTFCLASFDWIMSLEPHWFSTIFGVYNFAGMFVNAVAIMTFIVVLLKRNGYFPNLNENHFHDLGKLTFGFSVFWAYIWISQLLLIWYANIPEEVTYYITRWSPHFNGLFYLNLAINFLFPFLVLMSRAAKRDLNTLLLVTSVLIFGRWLDLYVMIMPNTVGEHSGIGILEIGTFAGFAGLFMLVFLRSLSKRALMPKKAAYLEESLSYTS